MLRNSDESELEEEETVQEKKIRLAKSFIEQLEKRDLFALFVWIEINILIAVFYRKRRRIKR